MRLKGELLQVLNPRRTHIAWGIYYVGLTALVLGGLYGVASQIKTHIVPTGKVQINTPYSTYVVGETITFSITNDYNAPVYFTNQCPTEPLAVYRQSNGKWVRLHDEASAKDCPDEERQVGIPPSSTVTSSFAPWHHLFNQAGKYRLVAVVNAYNSLPYVDLEVITPPPPPAQAAPNVLTNQPLLTFNNLVQPQTQTSTTPSQPILVPPTKPVAKTYLLNVNSSGNYDLINLTLNSGDYIQIVYSKPRYDEVVTRFTPKPPTTNLIQSITVDSEFYTQTQQFNSKGTWTFQAENHSGNSGTLTVN